MSAEFIRQINGCKDKVDKLLDQAVRRVAFSVYTQIVQNTPVDTGRARGNWHIDVNLIDIRIIEPTGAEKDPSYDGTEKALTAVGQHKLGSTIFISNNLPYIRRLNDGHSLQSPAGFIEEAIRIGKDQGMELSSNILEAIIT